MDNDNKFPVMDDETRTRFCLQVRALLLKGRMKSGEVARWAAGTESGYGKYFTYEEALRHVGLIIDELNEEARIANRAVAAEVRKIKADLAKDFPILSQYLR